MTFLCDTAIGVHDIDSRKIAAADDPIDNASGDLQFLGDLLHGYPFGVRGSASILQHTEELLQVGKEALADRAIAIIRSQIALNVLLLMR
jgi:hypothetical protein